ncbi:uncharacterized protein BDV14DRAFT_185842 [Aspergillus stella-maris]|uniref:uncharacterized protein n=1 Tax=Aspergillus stella-maris TaxID=1810926 RepID=UPI003CCC9A45
MPSSPCICSHHLLRLCRAACGFALQLHRSKRLILVTLSKLCEAVPTDFSTCGTSENVGLNLFLPPAMNQGPNASSDNDQPGYTGPNTNTSLCACG